MYKSRFDPGFAQRRIVISCVSRSPLLTQGSSSLATRLINCATYGPTESNQLGARSSFLGQVSTPSSTGGILRTNTPMNSATTRCVPSFRSQALCKGTPMLVHAEPSNAPVAFGARWFARYVYGAYYEENLISISISWFGFDHTKTLYFLFW